MRPLLIVKAQVVPQPLPCLTGTGVIFEIDLLVFNGTPQPFRKNVIKRATLAIHADAHIMGEEQLRVLRTGKVTALIAITNLRSGLRQCSLQRFQHEGDLQGLIEFPTDHIAGIPIQDRHQVHPAAV